MLDKKQRERGGGSRKPLGSNCLRDGLINQSMNNYIYFS